MINIDPILWALPRPLSMCEGQGWGVSGPALERCLDRWVGHAGGAGPQGGSGLGLLSRPSMGHCVGPQVTRYRRCLNFQSCYIVVRSLRQWGRFRLGRQSHARLDRALALRKFESAMLVRFCAFKGGDRCKAAKIAEVREQRS